MSDGVKPISEGYVRTLTDPELEALRRHDWFRRVGREMARNFGEPVLYFADPVGSSLSYLVPITMASPAEKNASHEVLGSPAGDTVQ